MDIAHSSSFEAAPPDDADCPAIWMVLVYRLDMAERRQRISDDWEQFAFGVPKRRPGSASIRH